jgi:hypothetical protein
MPVARMSEAAFAREGGLQGFGGLVDRPVEASAETGDMRGSPPETRISPSGRALREPAGSSGLQMRDPTKKQRASRSLPAELKGPLWKTEAFMNLAKVDRLHNQLKPSVSRQLPVTDVNATS